MSEQDKKNKKPVTGTAKKHKKKELDRSTVILITGLVLIAIPCLILGWILISASLDTGTPILGDRFQGDLDPAITSEQISQIETQVASEGSVDSVTVELATATLRIYVDAADSLSEEEATALSQTVYQDVISVLPESTYFTSTSSKKMYDLEVHVYNDLSLAGTDGYMYVIRTKNAAMEQAEVQTVSKPLDADLAQQLRDELEEKRNPSDDNEDEGIVSGEDTEQQDNSEGIE